jgi:hypothetical protein
MVVLLRRKGMRKVILYSFVILLSISIAHIARSKFILLTEEEAAAEDVPEIMTYESSEETSFGFSVERTIRNSGPSLIVIEPKPAKQHMSPVSLIIDFFPKTGTAVDLTKLKLEFLKLIPINVTNRVRDYISENGIRAEEVEIPTGKFKIRITLGDTAGGITQQVFGITIVK